MSQSIITRSRNIYTTGAKREKTCNQPKGREKAGKESHVGFGLAPDWLRTQHAFCDLARTLHADGELLEPVTELIIHKHKTSV